ncbi:hypothetical protein N9089_05690, partial [Crocinitomicaceae bacterium]|nr:hypothetical protein [Crocinitomicaceae bacterium]
MFCECAGVVFGEVKVQKQAEGYQRNHRDQNIALTQWRKNTDDQPVKGNDSPGIELEGEIVPAYENQQAAETPAIE